MNNPKHTKGPWTGGYECINSPDGRLIANVWYSSDYNKRNESSNFSVDEGKANSRLIASAPELLEACEIALQLLSEQPSFAEMFGDGDLVKRTLLQAIAKATGGSNE